MSHVAVKSQSAKIISEMVSSVFQADVLVDLHTETNKKKERLSKRNGCASITILFRNVPSAQKREKKYIFFSKKDRNYDSWKLILKCP